MTTKPRAFRFRVGRRGPQEPAQAAALAAPSGTEDGFGDRTFPTAKGQAAPPPEGPATAAAAAVGPAEPAAEEPPEIAAIRAEGLTGRQLRMARRVAQRHGLRTASDYDAVLQLRKKGIDPFKHGNMLELVVGETKAKAAEDAGASGEVKLPQTVPHRGPQLPGPELAAEDRREREIVRVQREIARRRRRKLAALFVRLAAFVLLPTFLSGYYFFVIATPMYATKSEFVIQQATPQGAGSMGSLFSGTAMATVQDSITVQSYLQSREAMLRLDGDHGFKAAFADPSIDELQRLEPDATNEEAYALYQRNVKIGYDPTEGILRMEVVAPDAQLSAEFSRALISYAEEQVDQLTQRLREDQMAGARENYADAERKVLEAQQRVIELQEQRGIISADAEVSLLMNQISAFETELNREQLALQQLLENARPNETRVAVSERNIARLTALIAELRAQMTESDARSESLARITGELLMAQGDLETRRMLLAESLQQMETARIEANRQVRYLSTGVSPVAPDQATYPRGFENTAVAFLIFAGIYLMISLTVSILREQVSA